MSLWKKLSTLFARKPLTLRMTLVPDGVKVGVYKENEWLPYSALATSRDAHRAPEPVIRFLSNDTNYQALEDGYRITYPAARNLYQAVRDERSDVFLLECDAVERLVVTACPADFALHWAYSRPKKCLERKLIHAERHLGLGWFQRGDNVWLLRENLPVPIIQALSLPSIPSRHIYQFVSRFIPASQQAGLPFSCDLEVHGGFWFRLEINKMLKRSIDVQVVTDSPQIARDLQYLEGDDRNMLSGNKLLPGFRPLMGKALLGLARSGEVHRLSGDDLVTFIQDELRPNAARLGIDMQQIDAKYRIIDAAGLDLTWQLEHVMHRGIGRYKAKPYLATASEKISLQELKAKVAEGKRFHQIKEGWIAFSSTFMARLSQLEAENVSEFYLDTREVLGNKRSRLKTTHLDIPKIDTPGGATALEIAQNFLDTLRFHGLPCGLVGLQVDVSSVLALACAHLLRDYSNAKILWIVTNKKKLFVRKALQEARVPLVEGPQRDFSPTNGKVVIVSPEMRSMSSSEWTLIVFHDLDKLVSSTNQAWFYRQAKRAWSIATFSRENWHQDPKNLVEIMRFLQLAPSDLEVFRQKCVQVHSDQNQGLLSRLVSPFKKVLSGDTAAQSGDVPIPPRKSVFRIETAPPHHRVDETQRPTFEVSVSYTSSGESFVKQAQRYVNRIETGAEYTPFMQYWPTYEGMTPTQQKWYFYWRTQLRQGNWLPTDLSYLFVHIYEALNLIGFRSAQASFDYLVRFWRHYRTLQPKLDRYLIDWLADFTIVYRLSQTALDWYGQAVREGAVSSDFDLSVEAWVQTGSNFLVLPDELLYRLTGYDPTKSKFYKQYNAKLCLDDAYRQGLQAVDRHLRQSGQSLPETYRPPRTRTVQREPFASALHEYRGQPIVIAEVHPWSSCVALASRLTSVIKFADNIFRERANFKSKLHGIDLADDWANVLKATFVIKAPKREIKIDMASVEVLKAESEELRERLLVEDEIDEMSTETEAIPQPIGAMPATAEVGFVQRPDHVSGDLLTDLAEIAAIMGDANSTEAGILRIFQTHNWEASPTALESAIQDSDFMSVEIDRINGRAVAYLGDALVFEEDGQFVVAEDYRDEIAYVLDHPDYAQNDLGKVGLTSTTADYAELQDEWASFARKMQPYHWEALAALLSGVDVITRLDAIARSVHLTSSRLTDDINEYALDSIGDIVIDSWGEIPRVEEEDIEGLRALLDWADSKALLEQ